VLHVITEMTRGGIETWLMHVLRHIDRDRFQMDFLVQTTREAYYDQEIRGLGSRLLPCLEPRQPWVYAANFRRILKENPPYDVIHSHVHFYNGVVLALARRYGIPIRIAHSHTSIGGGFGMADDLTLLRQGYARSMRYLINRYATKGLAASREAAQAVFGPDWQNDPRWQVFYCSIDLDPFEVELSQAAQLRASLGLPEDAFVVGTVGRLTKAKNHSFLLDITAELRKRQPNTYLLVAGEGQLRAELEAKASRLGLDGRVIFAGVRPDIPNMMRAAMDVFVLPSFFEGLPLVGLEAQAAGLPLIMSDTITNECVLVPDLVRRLSLAKPAGCWAEVLLEARQVKARLTPEKARAIIKTTPFDIDHSVEALQQIYAGYTR
jgi:glycosyltransferase involved in cell wall biosynthesis